MTGVIHGVGLGPGDPELMSVRADRLVRAATTIAYFRKAGRRGHARAIIDGIFPAGARELPMEYPVTTEIPLSDPRYNRLLSGFYEEWAEHLADLAKSGEDVVVLCEGDPFFYGSFMHLYARLKDVAPVEVTPAITGMSAAWTATGAPITWGDDVLTVLMATLPEAEMARRMADADALVVMKIGKNIAKTCAALKSARRFDDAWIVEYAAMGGQTVRRLAEADCSATPYFSIVIVHGRGRRP